MKSGLRMRRIQRREHYVYVQSLPPKRGMFVHHAPFSALMDIVNRGCLRAGKHYTVSLTTDPGRYLSPLPLLGVTVDGFVETPSDPLIQQNTVIPCLYRVFDEDALDAARRSGHNIFAPNEVPPEYRYLLDWVVKNQIFLYENEWMVIGQGLTLGMDFKLYLHPKSYTRFVRSSRLHVPVDGTIYRLTDHPLWRKDEEGSHRPA